MKKAMFLIIIIFISGCSKYANLSDLAIIKSIGIEYNNGYTLYAEIIDEIDKDNNPKTKIIKVNNKNLSLIFEDLKKVANKEIYLSHIDLIIFDFNLKENNYQEIINYFINNQELRNDFLCILSNDIGKLLNISKYDEIEQIINANNENKQIIKISFEELIKEYFNKKEFTISLFKTDNQIHYQNNYHFKNNKLERIYDE